MANFDIIEQPRRESMTIFLAEQNANLILQITDYRYEPENSRVTLEDTGAALLAHDGGRRVYPGGWPPAVKVLIGSSSALRYAQLSENYAGRNFALPC